MTQDDRMAGPIPKGLKQLQQLGVLERIGRDVGRALGCRTHHSPGVLGRFEVEDQVSGISGRPAAGDLLRHESSQIRKVEIAFAVFQIIPGGSPAPYGTEAVARDSKDTRDTKDTAKIGAFSSLMSLASLVSLLSLNPYPRPNTSRNRRTASLLPQT